MSDKKSEWDFLVHGNMNYDQWIKHTRKVSERMLKEKEARAKATTTTPAVRSPRVAVEQEVPAAPNSGPRTVGKSRARPRRVGAA